MEYICKEISLSNPSKLTKLHYQPKLGHTQPKQIEIQVEFKGGSKELGLFVNFCVKLLMKLAEKM